MKTEARSLSWISTLYFAEGLPYVVIMTVSVIMYKCLDVSNSRIALLTGWLYLPWVIKPLWSPFVDIFGSKRRWILWSELLLGASFGGVAFSLTSDCFLGWSLAMFWITAFVSATQDIAADGFYMLGLSSKEQSLFVGVRTLFYRVAMIAGQGGIVMIAGFLSKSHSQSQAWQYAMGVLSITFVVLTIWHSLVLPYPSSDKREATLPIRRTPMMVLREFGTSIGSFFTKPGIGAALLFMLLYRFPEAQLVKLIGPFLLDAKAAGGMGITTEAVGITYGTIGVAALIAGGIVGGIYVASRGLRHSLLVMAWSMSLTCVTFVYLSFANDCQFWLINLCVGIEQFGYGFGTTAYTLYLIYYSRGTWATSHYALCTGIMALGMMIPGMAAGWLQEILGYQNFFIYTLACCAVTILVSIAVRSKISPDVKD